MKTLPRISIIVLLVMLVAFTLGSSATTYTVGVKVGNWAKYKTYAVWMVEPTDANVTQPQQVKDANNTEKIEIEVRETSVTSVTISVTTRFKNATQKVDTYSGDIKIGGGNLSLMIAAAGLSVGDKISEAPMAFQINETKSKFYADAWREVNYAYLVIPLDNTTTIYEYYWDRATGILCAVSMLLTMETESYKTWASVITEMTETNIWQPQSPSSMEWGLIIAAIIIVSGFFVFLRKSGMKRRRKHRAKRTKAMRLIVGLNGLSAGHAVVYCGIE